MTFDYTLRNYYLPSKHHHLIKIHHKESFWTHCGEIKSRLSAFYVRAHCQSYCLTREHEFREFIVAFSILPFCTSGFISRVQQLPTEFPVAEISGGSQNERGARRTHTVQYHPRIHIKSNPWRFVKIFPECCIIAGRIHFPEHLLRPDILLQTEIFRKTCEA